MTQCLCPVMSICLQCIISCQLYSNGPCCLSVRPSVCQTPISETKRYRPIVLGNLNRKSSFPLQSVPSELRPEVRLRHSGRFRSFGGSVRRPVIVPPIGNDMLLRLEKLISLLHNTLLFCRQHCFPALDSECGVLATLGMDSARLFCSKFCSS